MNICQRSSLKRDNCTLSNSTDIVKKECNDKRNCVITANNKNFADMCRKTYKYLEVDYKCVRRSPSANPCSDNPCGIGAVCTNKNGQPICSCPADKKGDPNVRCCKTLRCGYFILKT